MQPRPIAAWICTRPGSCDSLVRGLRIPSVRLATWARKRFDHQTDHQTLPVATRSERRSGPPIGEAGELSPPIGEAGRAPRESRCTPQRSVQNSLVQGGRRRRAMSGGPPRPAAPRRRRPSGPAVRRAGRGVTVSDPEGAHLTSQTPSTDRKVTSRDQTAGSRTGDAESCGASARSIAAAASRSASAYTCA